MEPAPRFSVIIPAYNEEDYLPRLLTTLDVARHQFRGGHQAVEIIVADNASTDTTASIAKSRGCRIVCVEKRVIAAARNGGAEMARGEILCFIDADTQVHPDTFNVIDDLMASNRFIAGATGLRLERMSPGLAATYFMVLLLKWTMGVDAGVVFCRKADFERVGGYNDGRFFAEDIQFLRDLARLGKPRKQKLAKNTAATAIASVRKFDQYGDWHMFRMALQIVFRRGRLQEYVQKYWYTRDGEDK
jgi:glycosyltransferase involved in cell wall biosynthesis